VSRLDDLIAKHRDGQLDDEERQEAHELADSNDLAKKALNQAGFFTGHEDEAAAEAHDKEGDFTEPPARKKTSPIARLLFLFAAMLILSTVALAPILGVESALLEVEEGVLLIEGKEIKLMHDASFVSVPENMTTTIKVRGGVRLVILGPALLDISERGGRASANLVHGSASIGRPTFDEEAIIGVGPFDVTPGEGGTLKVSVKAPSAGASAEHAGEAMIEVTGRNAQVRRSTRKQRYEVTSEQLDALPENNDWQLYEEGATLSASLALREANYESDAASEDSQ